MHTVETKQKLSESRRAWLAANPDKHPWKRKDKFKSAPCEQLKQYLRAKGLQFVEEYQPLLDRAFSIDVAFPDIKLGIEVNGNQHYKRDGTLHEYYQSRHDLICSAGWRLIELHYSSCYNPVALDALIQSYEQPSYEEYFRWQAERASIREAEKPLARGVKARRKADEKWKPYIAKVLNSGIDFSKWGWVTEVAQLLELPPQKVSNWIDRYIPDFYERQLVKRRGGR